MAENKKVTIVTHSSGFHTDDVFAVATLLLVLEKDHDVTVVRSRDADVIKSGDYVLDVGGINDPKKNRFDHHQSGGAGKRGNAVPYASFGLVWKKYGEKLSGSVEASLKIDQMLVQPIDAGDNGLQFVETKIPGLHSFDIGAVTSFFSPTWKEDLSKIDGVFMTLVSYAKILIARVIVSVGDSEEAKKIVLKIYNSSSDKRLIILDNSKYPWEEVLSKLPEPLYVVYKNISDDTWTVKGIRSDTFTFTTRKKLPEKWAGKMDSELEEITGVKGSVFCHNARFMAVAMTKGAILKLAEIALTE